MRKWSIGLPVLSLMLALPVQAQSVVCPPQPLPPEPKPDLEAMPMPSPTPSVQVPSMEEGLLNRSKEAYQNQEYSKAENLLKQLLQKQPQNSGAWSNFGDALRRQSKKAEAKQAYDRAIQADQRNIQAYMGRAILAKPDAAEIDLSQSIEVMLWIDRDIYINVYKAFLQANPNYEDAHKWLGFALSSQLLEDPNWVNLVTNSIDLNDFDRFDLKRGAAKTFQSDQLEPITQHYRQAHQRFPNNSEFFEKLVEILQVQGNHAETIQVYQESIQRRPRSEKLYLGLGRVLMQARRLEEAQQTFCQALQVSKLPKQEPPSLSGSLLNLSAPLEGLIQVLKLQNHPLAVIPLYKQEIQIANPRTASDLRYSLIKVLRHLQQWEDVIPVYRAQIADHPNHYLLYVGLSETYGKLGNLSEGISTIQLGLKVAENDPDQRWKAMLERRLAELRDPQIKPKN